MSGITNYSLLQIQINDEVTQRGVVKKKLKEAHKFNLMIAQQGIIGSNSIE